MTEYACPTCGPKWNRAFNTDHRCVTCGSIILVTEENGPVVQFLRVGDHDLPVPEPSKGDAAAFDLRTIKDITLYPGDEALVSTGWAMAPPAGCAGLLLPRSGLGATEGIVLGNLVGLIDPDYRGEIKAKLWYRRAEGPPVVMGEGARIAQLLLVPYMAPVGVEVTALNDTERGEGGFGSSGRA